VASFCSKIPPLLSHSDDRGPPPPPFHFFFKNLHAVLPPPTASATSFPFPSMVNFAASGQPPLESAYFLPPPFFFVPASWSSTPLFPMAFPPIFSSFARRNGLQPPLLGFSTPRAQSFAWAPPPPNDGGFCPSPFTVRVLFPGSLSSDSPLERACFFFLPPFYKGLPLSSLLQLKYR